MLYVSADDYIARLVIAEFERESGIDVQFVGDTEAKKTAGLANRLRSERDHPVADVFWSSEIFLTIALAEEGIFAPHTPGEYAHVSLADDDNRWFGFAARARVVAYSPKRIEPQAVPKAWSELTDERFRGRIAMADPRFGTTGGHLGAMQWYFQSRPDIGEAAFVQFIDGLAANDVQVLPGGNAAVVEAISSGQADLGMTDTDDVWAATRAGAEIEMTYPRHHPDPEIHGGGTLLIPNTVARVRGGPNPSNAAALIDFLLSPKVERMLAESDSRNVPMNDELAQQFPDLAVSDPLIVDWEEAAAMRQAAIDEFMRAKEFTTEAPRTQR